LPDATFFTRLPNPVIKIIRQLIKRAFFNLGKGAVLDYKQKVKIPSDMIFPAAS